MWLDLIVVHAYMFGSKIVDILGPCMYLRLSMWKHVIVNQGHLSTESPHPTIIPLF